MTSKEEVFLLWADNDCDCGADILCNIYRSRGQAEAFMANHKYREYWIEGWAITDV